MSYCRFGEGNSDVYVYASVYGGIECCGCALTGTVDQPWGSFNASTPEVMIEHLLLGHRVAGHTVPQAAIERLREEVTEGNHGSPQIRAALDKIDRERGEL